MYLCVYVYRYVCVRCVFVRACVHVCVCVCVCQNKCVDFPAVNWVVQLDCPVDVDTYIHRAGRTARWTSLHYSSVSVQLLKAQSCQMLWKSMILTLNFLVAVVNTLNSSKEISKLSFENADVKSICHCKQRIRRKLSFSSECMETKLCKLCTSFTSHQHSSCGMVWYRTLTVKKYLLKNHWNWN